MQTKFKESLAKLLGLKEFHAASPDNPKILVAVSGGIDSMCLAHLFHRIFYSNFAIATVNFSLRGEESDADEQLVKEWADNRSIPYYTKTFDTAAYCRQTGLSTQVAARDLRYSWFNSIIEEHSFDYIAVAHNLNDSVETFFLNILRGTGLQGLTGIRKKNGKIIRPLLSITRREIVELVKREQIPFREDSSNSKNDYSRNRLRNMVFPEFEMINQSFLKTVERDMSNVEGAAEIIEDLFLKKRAELFNEKEGRISVKKLLGEVRPDYWLYMILSEYGFNTALTGQIFESIEGQPGKEFHSESYLLLKDRDYLLLYPKGGTPSKIDDLPIEEFADSKHFGSGGNQESVTQNIAEKLIEETDEDIILLDEDEDVPGFQTDIDEKCDKQINQESFSVSCNCSREVNEYSLLGIRVRISVYPKPTGFKFGKQKGIKKELTADLFEDASLISKPLFRERSLLLDADLLEFPLLGRRWEEGDRFMPLGMTGYKKVSDYLTDIKLDKISKNCQPVLMSGDKIVALIGQRIDERYKITAHTKNILEVTVTAY